jgi:hypothetical protein
MGREGITRIRELCSFSVDSLIQSHYHELTSDSDLPYPLSICLVGLPLGLLEMHCYNSASTLCCHVFANADKISVVDIPSQPRNER